MTQGFKSFLDTVQYIYTIISIKFQDIFAKVLNFHFKIKTIYNQTKYWNLLEIRFNIIERGRDISILFNLLKKNMKDIINNEVLPIVKEKIGEEYLKFLTIGSITFTNTSELIITIRYKGDGKCPM